MEQKEVVHKYYVLGTTTLDKMLQIMSHLSMEGFIKLKDGRFPMNGETNLYKLMNRSDPLTSAFLHEKVDLSKLKKYLSDQGLPFAFKETAAGTNLYFRVKDEALAKKAIERVITDIKNDPKKILRTPGTMTFEEKVAYARNNPKYKGSIDKAPDLTKGRGK